MSANRAARSRSFARINRKLLPGAAHHRMQRITQRALERVADISFAECSVGGAPNDRGRCVCTADRLV